MPIKEKTCLLCDKTFTPKNPSPKITFCSKCYDNLISIETQCLVCSLWFYRQPHQVEKVCPWCHW